MDLTRRALSPWPTHVLSSHSYTALRQKQNPAKAQAEARTMTNEENNILNMRPKDSNGASRGMRHESVSLRGARSVDKSQNVCPRVRHSLFGTLFLFFPLMFLGSFHPAFGVRHAVMRRYQSLRNLVCFRLSCQRMVVHGGHAATLRRIANPSLLSPYSCPALGLYGWDWTRTALGHV